MKLSRKQKNFFKTRRSMQAVWKELHRGDAFAANNWQNDAMNAGLIEWNGTTFGITDKGLKS